MSNTAEKLAARPDLVWNLISEPELEVCSGDDEDLWCGADPEVAFVNDRGGSISIGTSCLKHVKYHAGINPDSHRVDFKG